MTATRKHDFILKTEVRIRTSVFNLKAFRARLVAPRLRFEAKPEALRNEFMRRVIDRKRPKGMADAIRKLKDKLVAEPPTIATRKASEMVLEVLVPELPELLLGSADLTPSNNTRTKGLKEVTPSDFSGRYIHYGIREMGMAAANGNAPLLRAGPFGVRC